MGWRRTACFGDDTAHAAILGVPIGLALELAVIVGVLVGALLVWGLSARGLAVDTAHGVLGHGAVSVALVRGPRLDLEPWLFGDVLSVTRGDLLVIRGGAAVVAILVWRNWAFLLTSTLSPDLARAVGLDPRRGRSCWRSCSPSRSPWPRRWWTRSSSRSSSQCPRPRRGALRNARGDGVAALGGLGLRLAVAKLLLRRGG